jgi:hypothetical protein
MGTKEKRSSVEGNKMGMEERGGWRRTKRGTKWKRREGGEEMSKGQEEGTGPAVGPGALPKKEGFCVVLGVS